MNLFVTAARQGTTFTENGAVALKSTGSELADQFGAASNFRGRALADVFIDQAKLVGEDPLNALRFVFYNRMVTRKITIPGSAVEGPGRVLGSDKTTEKVQKGQGQRDETFKRLLWYASNRPEVFYKNLWLLPVVGSFRDIWDLLLLADDQQIKLNVTRVFDTYTKLAEYSDLAKKFMPSVVANSVTVTTRAKERNRYAKLYATYLGLTYSSYRKLKSSGKAHEWQQLISRKELGKVNFGRIPGKALFLLTKGKFLTNQGLVDSYEQWLAGQPVAKFTGYVYELFMEARKHGRHMPGYQKSTLDKQFDGLIELAKQDQGGIQGNVWCALDTSDSMTWETVNKSGTQPFDICLSLGLYFSTLNTGAFHKNVIMFGSTSYVQQLSGSFTDMVAQVPSGSMGGTNFQSVIDEIVRIRRSKPGVPLSDYPQTLLVVSDMQFNPASAGAFGFSPMGTSLRATLTQQTEQTNYQLAMNKLRQVFPEEFVAQFKIIWWHCTAGRVSASSNKPSGIDDAGTYVFSGFDGSVISLLLGGEPVVVDGVVKKDPSMEDTIKAALNQEILTYAQV
jgi:hypothetical protein